MSIDIEDFVKDCRTRGLTEHTIQTYKSNIAVFLNFVGNPLNVDIPILCKFLDYLKEMEYRRGKHVKKGVHPKTIKAYFSAISTYYEYLVFTRQLGISPIPSFTKRYLSRIKQQYNGENSRQLIDIKQMSQLVTLDMPIPERAILMILAKTGIRRGELIAIDRDDLNLEKKEIILKPKAKRTNRLVFFDSETELVLRAYLEWRDKKTKSNALFVVNSNGFRRINRNQVNEIVARHGSTLGLHDPEGSLNQKLTPHCFRHFFTTVLRRAGMPREFIQELRGDRRKDAIDIYDHIDLSELKDRYFKCIPGLFNGYPEERVRVSTEPGVKVSTEPRVKVSTEPRVKVSVEPGVKVSTTKITRPKGIIGGFTLTLYEYIQRHEGSSTKAISTFFLKNKDYVKRYLYNLKDYGFIINGGGNWYSTSKKPIAISHFIKINSTDQKASIMEEIYGNRAPE